MTPDDPKERSPRRGLIGPRLAAIAMIILGGVTLAQISRIGTGAGFIVIGPRFFPWVVGLGLLVLGFLLLLRTTFLLDHALAADVAAEEVSTDWPATLLVLASLVGYAWLLRPLGYALATTLFFPTSTRILGSTRLWRDIVIGLALGFGIYLIFTRVLGVRLPAGLLSGIL